MAEREVSELSKRVPCSSRSALMVAVMLRVGAVRGSRRRDMWQQQEHCRMSASYYAMHRISCMTWLDGPIFTPLRSHSKLSIVNAFDSEGDQ
mmetsp:Transcript_58904/g.131282  ORF Transcript_58904/g.131282 Transcript_58904/m.131282 type:complete len:92 (-) Transcript_58904:5-280(-)